MFSYSRCLLFAVLGMLTAPQMTYAADKSDKTGTNPIKFTHDFRVYNEYIWLNTPGDSSQNITTMEYRQPFAKGKWQFRARIRYTSLNMDLDDDGHDEVNEDGLGEVDFRVLTVPILDMANKRALAVGFETFLPTAEDGLGSQRLSFGPQVFGVFFNPFGIKNSLIAPAYQHKFSVWEDDGVDPLHQGLIDVFILKITADKQQWALINPQFILDFEEDKQFANIDVEVGTMLDKWLGTKGYSAYLRPGFQIGKDRPAEGSIEIGFKVVW